MADVIANAGAVAVSATAYSSAATIGPNTDTVTIWDNFNRTNDATQIGVANTGQTWTAWNSTGGIISNQVYSVTGAPVGAGFNLPVDGSVEATMTTPNQYCGVSFRTTGTSDFLGWHWRSNPGNTDYRLEHYNGSTSTVIGSAGVTPTAGDVLRVDFSGDDIKAYVNDVLKVSTTNSTYISNTWHGLVLYEGIRVDNFSYSPTPSRVVTATTATYGVAGSIVAIPAPISVVATAYSPTVIIGPKIDAVTIRDSFNRVNNATQIGIADTGQTWTDWNSTGGIISNQVYAVTGAPVGAGFNLTSPDGTLEVTVTTPNQYAGLSFRTTGTSDFLGWHWRSNPGNTDYRLEHYNGSTSTVIGTAGATPTAGDILRVEFFGNDIKAYLNGALKVSTSNSTYVSNTWHGLVLYEGFRADNFSYSSTIPATVTVYNPSVIMVSNAGIATVAAVVNGATGSLGAQAGVATATVVAPDTSRLEISTTPRGARVKRIRWKRRP